MDSPHLDPDAEYQLRKYREEQRRRHEQVSLENTGNTSTSQPYHPSPISTNRPTPSAPPLVDDTQSRRNLYPSLSSNDNVGEKNLKKSQEEEDERLARLLQQEEERPATPPQVRPSSNTYSAPSPTIRETPETYEDEQLAMALQESEQYQQPQDTQQTQPEPGPTTQSGGILSTIGTIGRGLYNVYNAYSQAHQLAQRDAEQQAEEQVREYNRDMQENEQRQQIVSDEALARRMQEEEANPHIDEHHQQQFRPIRQPPAQFFYRHPPAHSHLSPFGYDSDDEDIHMHTAPQPNPLMSLSSMFRNTGAGPEEPLFRHIQELMQETQHPPMYRTALPRHRYVFPRSAFGAQGVEELPPDLLNMMQGQTDTSYEALLELAERMQPVSRGASNQQIDQLPTRTYAAGSMPAEHCKCGICLADYEPGEELTSLPCLHSFHKACITHWLGINKICPVCRVEIAGAGAAQ